MGQPRKEARDVSLSPSRRKKRPFCICIENVYAIMNLLQLLSSDRDVDHGGFEKCVI